MKKMILLAAAALCLNKVVAQTTPEDRGNIKTPNTVTTKFNTDYPNANATWSRDGSNYRAEYNDRSTNVPHSVTYDKNGNMLTREERLSRGTYPQAIGDYYTKNYPDENYDVWSSTDGTGNVTYYTIRNNEMLWFDNNGNYKTHKPARSTSSVKRK
jgi:hypothetical protein